MFVETIPEKNIVSWTSMKLQISIGLLIVVLSMSALLSGCKLDEGTIADRIPRGSLIPLEQVPAIVLPEAKRHCLPEGTTIQHCEGDLYRFNHPDGTIWLRNSKGEDCGGVI